MAQFLALGLQLPADHPDRKKYFSLSLRHHEFNTADVGEITLINPGDFLVLYSDGVYDGTDPQARAQLEALLRDHYREPARSIFEALMAYAAAQDDYRLLAGEEELIDDKTVLVVKRTG